MATSSSALGPAVAPPIRASLPTTFGLVGAVGPGDPILLGRFFAPAALQVRACRLSVQGQAGAAGTGSKVSVVVRRIEAGGAMEDLAARVDAPAAGQDPAVPIDVTPLAVAAAAGALVEVAVRVVGPAVMNPTVTVEWA